MTANLPEVGAAQATDSTQPAFAAIWAEAAVSITFSAQMCQTSPQSSAGYISSAAANCFNRVWKCGPGYCERGFWGQPSASCPHSSQCQQSDRLRLDFGFLADTWAGCGFVRCVHIECTEAGDWHHRLQHVQHVTDHESHGRNQWSPEPTHGGYLRNQNYVISISM